MLISRKIDLLYLAEIVTFSEFVLNYKL